MFAQFSSSLVHKLLQLRSGEGSIGTTSIKFFPSCPNVDVESLRTKQNISIIFMRIVFNFLAWRCNNAILSFSWEKMETFFRSRQKNEENFFCGSLTCSLTTEKASLHPSMTMNHFIILQSAVAMKQNS